MEVIKHTKTLGTLVIKQIDKNRASHRQLLSNKKWGDKENFDLCINTTGLVIKDLIPFIIQYTDFLFEKKR